MKDRLKKIRSDKGLTQQEFADKIGVKRNTVATYEIGRNEPIDAVVKLICDKFHVNEQWLRTGEEPMYIESKYDDDIQRMVSEMLKDDSAEVKRRLVSALLKLSPEQIQNGIDWMRKTLAIADAADQTEEKPFEEMTIDEKVENYRRELEAEAASGKSEASRTENAEGA